MSLPPYPLFEKVGDELVQLSDADAAAAIAAGRLHDVIGYKCVLLTPEEEAERRAQWAAAEAEADERKKAALAHVNRAMSDQRRREQRIDEFERLVENGAPQESINRALLALLKG